MNSQSIATLLKDKLILKYGVITIEAAKAQVYDVTVEILREILARKRHDSEQDAVKRGRKKVYYLCMEFLIGRNLRNALYNLELNNEFAKALESIGQSLESLYELEVDPALGNGGLGRLAACFLDSLATLDYPATGYSIKYEYGLFRQRITDNVQIEEPDRWLDTGKAWLNGRPDKVYTVKLGGKLAKQKVGGKTVTVHKGAAELNASCHDILVSGAGGKGVSTLRLWTVTSGGFDMTAFSKGKYGKAAKADVEADMIGKLLYPADEHKAGKMLRIAQQYLLVSASLQDILGYHIKHYTTLDTLPKYAAIHLNDTHPALAIPELMRLLMDGHSYTFDKAWDITTRTIAYTNHTVLPEALEKWDISLIKERLPRIFGIIEEIDAKFIGDYNRPDLAALDSHQVRMANLCVIGSRKVNGVAELHSEIVRKVVFREFAEIWPDKFCNVTNGIAHRRWLDQSNPRLASLIRELIGDGYYLDASKLSGLSKFVSDKTVIDRLGAIKASNKKDFAKWLYGISGRSINPESRIDSQIKRLHEYKRQLLNVLRIMSEYSKLLANPDLTVTPQTFVFGCKAAGSYYHAKRVISLISSLGDEIAKRPKIKAKLDVVLVENYNVSKAERIIPATDVSEQISMAGKEASGTGNMKFMLNGALTLGTMDGANVEIFEEVGDDNIFIFGKSAAEIQAITACGYNAGEYFRNNARLQELADMLRTGFNGNKFGDIADYLAHNDPFMCNVDFDDYLRAVSALDRVYQDPQAWQSKCLINIAGAGRFSADRSIKDYAKSIWNLD